MKFSPVTLAVCLAASVFYTAYFGFNAALFIILFILWIIYSSIRRCIDTASLIIIIAVAFSSISYAISSSAFMHKSINYTDKEVALTGVTISSAQESMSSDNYKYTFFVKTITENNETTTVNDTILLTTPLKLPCGESVTVKGTLSSMQEQMNENGFDMALYYKSQNIYTRMYSENISECEPITVLYPSVICGKFRDWVDSIIYKYYYGDGAAILSAVLTGNPHHFSAEFNSVLNRTAFKHLYHPAFLHILIISFLVGLFSTVVHRRIRSTVLIILLLIYALLNCAQIGFTRCILSAVLMTFFCEKNGNSYFPDTIAWIVIFAALLTPSVLFHTGFILSISAGLIMWAFLPYFTEKYQRLPRFIRRTAAVITVSVLIYTPVALCFHNSVCIYTFFMTFVTIPLVMIILIGSPIVFTMLSLFGSAMPLKPYLDSAILALLKIPLGIKELPLSHIIIPTPSPAGKLLIVCLLFWFYYHIKKRKPHRRIFASLACGFSVSLIVSSVIRIGTTEFIFVNVGQGDGAVIHTAYGATVLIDGGGGSVYSEYNPGEMVYLPYLESKGYSKIDAAFITHFHLDHVQGIIAAIENLNVENVFIPSPKLYTEADALSLLRETETAAKLHGTNIHYITENTKLTFDGGLTISVYAPDEVITLSDDENDYSLLIKAEYGETSVLYTGDMTAYAENEYMKRGIDLSSDILKVAHHGSAKSTHSEWVNSVNPEYAVISCGENNNYGHPSAQTLDNLNGIPLLRTDLQGDIKIVTDKSGIRKITTLK